jgi:single-strand DNA-binding protein
MIKLQVIGHLGKDCTTNVVSGKNVINFNVAHSERYKDATGVTKERTTWVECAYWTERTAIAPYLKKGTQVYAEGTVEVRTYTKSDGTFGASMVMRVLNVQLLGSGNKTENTTTVERPFGSNGIPAPAGEVAEPADDLPF